MVVAKIIGLETEFGIAHRGVPDPNPIAASSILISSYVQQRPGAAPAGPIGWDFEDESPGTDARGEVAPGARAPVVETHLVNAVLTNGARYYVDHAHPELSTPECADAHAAVVWDRAAEEIVIASMAAASAVLPPGEELVAYKNNSDRKGNSYGCHENYLVDRAVPFGSIVSLVTAHFVTRQIYTGAGKVGTEAPGRRPADVAFQLTQRADFFEEEVGLETTLKRPIVNTRDEPHADAAKYRRLHVIVGDANLAEVATFLKVGVTAIVLALLEEGAAPPPVALADPVGALQQVSYDLSLRAALPLADGGTTTALGVQWDLLRAARAQHERGGLALAGGPVVATVLDRWEAVLEALEADPMSLSGVLDWPSKLRLIDGYRERHDLAWDDPRLAAMDLQYHDLRPDRSLARRVGLEKLATDEEVRRAVTEPPSDTRAFFRGRCLQRFAPQVVSANWDSIVFDVGGVPLRRVAMMEPTRGTEAHVGSLLEGCTTVSELLDMLGT